MGFGQYSDSSEGKLTKREMVAEVESEFPSFVADRSNCEKLENNTLRFDLPNGARHIRFHHTDIIVRDKRGNITLSTGGWRSITTKGRMCNYLPSGWSVYSGTGTWHVRTPQGTFPFADGIRFDRSGKLLNPSLAYREEKRVARDKALVAKFLKHAKAKGWADPAGDPWVFSQPDRSVMMDWLRGNYFTARLMSLALGARFGEAGVSLYMSDIARNGGKPRSAYEVGILRKYIYRSLGVA